MRDKNMNTVTESDIRELKDLIKTQGIELSAEIKALSAQMQTLNIKFDTKFDALEKRMTENYNNLDKRITTQEFIHRAVFISIIGLIATSLGTIAAGYFWNNPPFH